MERIQIICVLVGYFAVLFVMAIVASRRMKSEADFFIAGKKLGYWVVSFSSRATGESAWLLLGLTGLGWAVGMHAFWVVLGEVMGVTACWIWLAGRWVASRFPEGAAVPGDILYEMIPGFILAFAAIFIVSMLTRPPSGTYGEVVETTD